MKLLDKGLLSGDLPDWAIFDFDFDFVLFLPVIFRSSTLNHDLLASLTSTR